jgi:alpha-tubulin suppressor-like RCC1 family protein
VRIDFGTDLITDICCGFNHAIALNTDKKVYVWGNRMAPYPNVELTRDYLRSNLNLLSRELNQTYPRLLRNHMIHYKVAKIYCGPFTSALITDQGEVLI